MSDSLLVSATSPAATARVRAGILALSRWENEGGACLASITADAPPPSDAEADPLRTRVIALVTAFLADATDQQHTLALETGNFVSPCPATHRTR